MAAKKKTTAKKKTATKKAAAQPVRKIKAIKEAYTKTAVLNQIADNTGLSRKEVSSVLDELKDIIEGHVKKNGVQNFTMPGLLKIKVIRKPATKARKGINPFTGEETVFKAKPARNVVKIQPLKALKDMAL